MANIFISYSSDDKSIVKLIAGLLIEKGWSVWWDRQIPIGQNYDNVIENELKESDCAIVVWTKRSVASEWVKNEANEAANKKKLVPILLEQVEIPLAFKRIESAMMINWQGDKNHPELELLYHAIDNIIDKKKDVSGPKKQVAPIAENNISSSIRGHEKPMFPIPKSIIFGLGILILLIIGYFIVQWIDGNAYANKTITVRIFDMKKRPVSNGEVKISLREYIRNQSIDNAGQALFTSIPANELKNKMKIQINCPGYATKIIDTILTNLRPIEITLPLTEVIFISGKIKTASEMPIKGVEVNVDGTRYVAYSITDGTYNLRLEEYTLGDEITITTSHSNYEDKTLSLKINSPEIINQDIFLQPINH